MNELANLVKSIMEKYQETPRTAVQELFPLLASQPEQYHHLIKKAILLCLEKGHEWANAVKYLLKWNDNRLKNEFIDRMRVRTGEPPLGAQLDLNEQIKRLVQLYWKTVSPKKEEAVYKEPIDIKKLMKNAQSLTPKDQLAILPPQKIEKPVQPIERPAVEPKKQAVPEKKEITFAKIQPINEQPNQEAKTWRGESFGPEPPQDSNSVSNALQRKEKADPLGAVTGRPPILKKKSIFENNIKISAPNSDGNEETKKEDGAKGRMATSKIFSLLRKIEDRKEVKSNENWQNFGKVKESAPNLSKVNEQFPADKFNFGSNKKGSAEQETKKIAISPIKYNPNQKLVKIIRDQSKPEKKVESLHEFSFASSQQKEPKARPVQPNRFRPSEKRQQEEKVEEQFIFHDYAKESDKDEVLSGSESFKKLKEVAQTPVFKTIDSKNRRSSVGMKSQEAFEVDEVLNLYQADVKLRYFMREIEGRNGADTMAIFQDEFSRFLKTQEALRT